jgi:itaconyl-CoA hydratase
MANDFLARARLRPKGNRYEDFTVGRAFAHHWGRTINHGDNSLFTTLTLHFNPLYTNVELARAHGHPDVVVNPMLVFTTVFGLSVEDLSEGGGAFLGVEELTFHAPVYPGDTLTALSTVVDCRESSSNKTMGIVTWHTEGFNQRDVRVIDFKRTNLINKRDTPQ